MAKTIYVNYCDAINEPKVKAIMHIFSDIINRERPDSIYCLFSSSGGMVDFGISLYNFLRALPVEIIMHNTGSIDSIANVVFLAGNIRYTSAHSSFLFHGVNWGAQGNITLNRTQMVEVLSGLETSETKIAGIMSERTKLSTEEVKGLFAQGETKGPAFALEKGIVSEIINPTIPKGVPIISFNLP